MPVAPSGPRRPGHGMPKPETKAVHGGVLGVQCLHEPLGEPACSHFEMEVRPGVGGQILPSCGPHAAAVGDPAHGVHGSRFLALLWEPPQGGGGARGEDPFLHLVAFQRGKVGE